MSGAPTLGAVPADDGPARARITAQLDATLFVEAGAGTGKTRQLVERVTALVATGRLDDVRAVAAITFTEAAAAELRHRLRRGLEHAAGGELPPEAGARCRAALDHLDEAAIATLHGFAQRLLAEFPLEAGLPPGFEVLDAIQAELRFAERWAAFVDRLLADPEREAVLLRAFTLGAHLGDLREVAQAFHANWDRLLDVPPAPGDLRPVDATPVLAAARAAVAAATAVGPGHALSARVLDELAPAADRLAALVAAGDERAGLVVVLHELPAIKPRGRAAAAVAEVKEALDALAEARAAFLADLGDDALAHLVHDLVAFTLDGVAERRRAGRLEFHDLLVFALLLLRHRPDVRRALGRRIGTLLIDEFQDTDPLQVEIAVRLALADPAAEPPSWADAEVGPGRLFFVGDPKQSIYRFRRADLAVYEGARARFAAEPLALTRNHRSVPGVLAWVNAVFSELMQPQPQAQPAFTPLAAARADDPGGGAPAVLTVGGPHADVRVGEVREVEAGELAALVARLRADGRPVVGEGGEARPLRYADVAVLLPTRASLGAIEHALAGAGVPYRIESRSLVFATDEVAEVLAVLAAVDDPGDEVGIVAALRGSGLACSDADLLSWRLAGGRWRYPVELPEGVEATHPVAVALGRLAELHEARAWLPVNLLVDRVIRQGGFVELSALRPRPRDHWRRYRLLLDEARAFVEAGGESLADFVAWVVQQADEEASRVEAVVPEADDDAVRILTVHGAKGLEFPVVVLTGLNVGPPPLSPRVVWAGERPELCVGRADRRLTTRGYAAALEAEKRHDELERCRLLYVAATRARDLLVVGLHHKEGTRCLARDLVDLDARVGLPWHAVTPEELAPAGGTGPEGTRPEGTGGGDGAGAGGDAAAAGAEGLARAEAAVAERARRVAAAQRSQVLTPTELGGPGPVGGPASGAPAPRRAGAGTAVGRAVHAVLEAVDLHDPAGLDALAERAAADAGVAGAAADVARLARAAWASAPVREAAASGRCWREVPVTAVVGDRLVEGAVDLLYEAGGELVVVDHKTDRARTDAELEAAAARYRGQGAAYAVALEAALGRPVSRVVLVFLRGDEAVPRTLAGDELAAACAEVRVALAGGPEGPA